MAWHRAGTFKDHKGRNDMKVPSAKKELLSFYPDVIVEGFGVEPRFWSRASRGKSGIRFSGIVGPWADADIQDERGNTAQSNARGMQMRLSH
jgi:hypothetical protein